MCVGVCVCVWVCLCMLCLYACWVVCRRRCNYVSMFGVFSLTLVFLRTVEELEGSVIHVEIVPFMLMHVNVCDYPMYLVCVFSYI